MTHCPSFLSSYTIPRMVCLLSIKPLYFLSILLLHPAVATPLAFAGFAPDEALLDIDLHDLSLLADPPMRTLLALANEPSAKERVELIASRRQGGWAINGLMTELIEDEVRYHVLSPRVKPGSNGAEAAERLIQVLHTYLK